MDRAYIDRLLSNSRVRATVEVDLPVCGMTLRLLKSLTNTEKLSIGAAGGTDEDAQARYLTGFFRWMLVDEERNTLLRSFGEAAAFINALDERDMQVVFETLMELATESETEQAEVDPDAGKGR